MHFCYACSARSSAARITTRAPTSHLCMRRCTTASLPCLAALSQLQSLDASRCCALRDISGLSRCGQLLSLDLTWCRTIELLACSSRGRCCEMEGITHFRLRLCTRCGPGWTASARTPSGSAARSVVVQPTSWCRAWNAMLLPCHQQRTSSHLPQQDLQHGSCAQRQSAGRARARSACLAGKRHTSKSLQPW